MQDHFCFVSFEKLKLRGIDLFSLVISKIKHAGIISIWPDIADARLVERNHVNSPFGYMLVLGRQMKISNRTTSSFQEYQAYGDEDEDDLSENRYHVTTG